MFKTVQPGAQLGGGTGQRGLVTEGAVRRAVVILFLPTVSCPALKAPPDGRKFGSKYLVNHEVHFTCDPGFRLVGPSSVVCLPNGTWTGAEPHCRGLFLLPLPLGLDPLQPRRGLLGTKGHSLGLFLPHFSIPQLKLCGHHV